MGKIQEAINKAKGLIDIRDKIESIEKQLHLLKKNKPIEPMITDFPMNDGVLTAEARDLYNAAIEDYNDDIASWVSGITKLENELKELKKTEGILVRKILALLDNYINKPIEVQYNADTYKLMAKSTDLRNTSRSTKLILAKKPL